MDNIIWILAESAAEEVPSSVPATPVTQTEGQAITKIPSDPNGKQVGKSPAGFNSSQLILLGLMVVIFYFLLFRGPRKQKQQHKKMVQSLEKNDKVRTIGGIIGTVVDIKDDEITLKVDESNNTKIKVIPSAIGLNLSKEKSS